MLSSSWTSRRGGSIFALPSGPRGAGRRGSAVQAFSPEAKTLAQGQFICPEHVKSERGPREVGDFAGRAGRRCGALGVCNCLQRRSLLSSSWTSRRGGSIFALPSGPRRAGRRGSAVQAFSPEAKTLAQGQFICPEHVKSERGPREVGDFAGRAGRRCGAWVLCSCLQRRSWLSSSWTSRRIEEKGGPPRPHPPALKRHWGENSRKRLPEKIERLAAEAGKDHSSSPSRSSNSSPGWRARLIP